MRIMTLTTVLILLLSAEGFAAQSPQSKSQTRKVQTQLSTQNERLHSQLRSIRTKNYRYKGYASLALRSYRVSGIQGLAVTSLLIQLAEDLSRNKNSSKNRN